MRGGLDQGLDDERGVGAVGALDHHRVARTDGCEHRGGEFGGVVGPDAAAPLRQGLVQVAHGGAGEVGRRDVGGADGLGQLGVVAGGLGAEFQHVGEHGQAAGRSLGQGVERGAHGDRVGVVALVHQGDLAAGDGDGAGGAAAGEGGEVSQSL